MLLSSFIAALQPLSVVGSQEREVTGIACDSRLVEPGNLFVAIPGFTADGHSHLPQAAARGAVAAIISKDVPSPPAMTVIRVLDSRRALGRVAAFFYDYPSRKLCLIGVTGTNGKTSTGILIQNLLTAGGHRPGLIGTVSVQIGDEQRPSTHTTPESLELQRVLAQMVQSGVSHAVLEVSSHALTLHRLQDCEFDFAVFTNLTPEHLDWHGDVNNYLAAKAILFEGLNVAPKACKRAVINIDDPASLHLLNVTEVPVITYGIKETARLQAREISITALGSDFLVVWDGIPLGRTRVVTPGYFSVYNSLAAIAVVLAAGVPWSIIAGALPTLEAIPGRFQPVPGERRFQVFVDYAHTPDGLENVLLTAKSFTKGRIIVVFGCGGDRDRSKRPIMGRIAALLADLVIVTTDNPRRESPQAIAREIVGGMEPGAKVLVELDRALAIRLAIAQAGVGDTVLIAGKGHEKQQIFAAKTVYFDDLEIAQEALEVIGHEGLEAQ